MEISIAKLGGIGASECGKLFTRDGLKAKTAQTLAFEKAEELVNGYRQEFTTIAMQHGIFSEEEAYQYVVKAFYPNSRYCSDESIPIADEIWATPDVIDETEQITIDIKCPYTPYTFWKNVKKLPDAYLSQNQMQMIATGHKKGAICLYLTSTETDQYGNKIEYDIPIEKRHVFIPIEAQPEYQKEIIQRINDFFPMRDTILSHLYKADELSDMEFFEICDKKKVTRFRDKSNLLAWEGKIVRNKNIYYTIE